MIICPSCGSTVNADLCVGCPVCGARAVGPPLAKAEHELPSFGRAAIAFAAGVAVAGAFGGFLVGALIENKSGWFQFWKVISAGEVAAWRVKWIGIPIALFVLWATRRIVCTIKEEPSRFIGLRAARTGLGSAVAVTIVIFLMIGITIPERLQQRQLAHAAAAQAPAYTVARALLTYRQLHGFLPAPEEFVSELKTLPDPDGAIAAALQAVDVSAYQPSTVVATGPSKTKLLPVRGEVIRKASLSVPASDHPSVSFTNYDLRLPGADKVLNTDDDLIVFDGLVMTVPQYQEFLKSRNHLP